VTSADAQRRAPRIFVQHATLAGCSVLLFEDELQLPRISPQLGALVVKYAPIIVLVILALGITAVTIYRPRGSSRVNSIGTRSEFASSCSSSARCLLTTAALEDA
jgi:hypothetical protein